MRSGARTPEELETLLEDAFVLQDRSAVEVLFEDGAVLVPGDAAAEVRGAVAIAQLAEELWERDYVHLADPGRVFQARDTALVLPPNGVSVLRRGADGGWRYAISLLTVDHADTKEVPRR